MDFPCDPLYWYVCDGGTEHKFPSFNPPQTTAEILDFMDDHEDAAFGTCAQPSPGREVYWPVCTNGWVYGAKPPAVIDWIKDHPGSTLGHCWGTTVPDCPAPNMQCFMGGEPVFLDSFFLDGELPSAIGPSGTFDAARVDVSPFSAAEVQLNYPGVTGIPTNIQPADVQAYLLAYDPKMPHMRLDLTNMHPPDFDHVTNDAVTITGEYHPVEVRYSNSSCVVSSQDLPTDITPTYWRPVDGPLQDELTAEFNNICSGTIGHSEYHVVVAACHNTYQCSDEDIQIFTGTDGQVRLHRLSSDPLLGHQMVLGDNYEGALAINSQGHVYALRINPDNGYSSPVRLLNGGEQVWGSGLQTGVQAMAFAPNDELYVLHNDGKLYVLNLQSGGNTVVADFKQMFGISVKKGDIAIDEKMRVIYASVHDAPDRFSPGVYGVYYYDLNTTESGYLGSLPTSVYEGLTYQGDDVYGLYDVSTGYRKDMKIIWTANSQKRVIVTDTSMRVETTVSGDAAACPPALPFVESSSSSSESSSSSFSSTSSPVSEPSSSSSVSSSSSSVVSSSSSISSSGVSSTGISSSSSAISSASSAGSMGSAAPSQGSASSAVMIAYTSCGNGIPEMGEECDDGNQNNADACSNTCRRSRCGDGIVQSPETCDEGPYNSNDAADTCRLNCRSHSCGDGTVDTKELCDDANRDNTDGCSNACRLGLDEQCSGNADCGSGLCVDERCVKSNVCGNGAVELRETCDDGNNDDGDGCSSLCLVSNSASCEDHEDCDSGLCVDGVCEQPAFCGDGIVQPGEFCDQGLANSNVIPNRCRENCFLASFGDGVVDNGEECDDGNVAGGDGCSQDAQEEAVAAEIQVEKSGPLVAQVTQLTQFQNLLPAALLPAPLPASFIAGAMDQQHGGAPLQNPETGPAALVVMLSGASAGFAWMKRRRR